MFRRWLCHGVLLSVLVLGFSFNISSRIERDLYTWLRAVASGMPRIAPISLYECSRMLLKSKHARWFGFRTASASLRL